MQVSIDQSRQQTYISDSIQLPDSKIKHANQNQMNLDIDHTIEVVFLSF